MKQIFLLLLFLFSIPSLYAQTDSLPVTPGFSDSVPRLNDSISKADDSYFKKLNAVLSGNEILNSEAKPVTVTVIKKHFVNKNFLFYSICVLVLFFALLKTFYARYFNNVFRVFFNTSLRQSQLTDQLIQAKLPSLLFNILFITAGGFYLFLLLVHLGHVQGLNNFPVLTACVAILTVVYFGKLMVLKFTGWISGYRAEADIYIFIIFLINKIIAIVLIPVIIIMAFADDELVKAAVLLSYLFIMLMLVLRFFRSYSILQNRIQVQGLHFFIYIIGIEILPLLLIYKSSLNLLTKYL